MKIINTRYLVLLTVVMLFASCKEKVNFYTIEVKNSKSGNLTTTISSEGLASLILNGEQYAVQIRLVDAEPKLEITKVKTELIDSVRTTFKSTPVSLGLKTFKEGEVLTYKNIDGGKEIVISVTQIISARIKRDHNGFIPACLDENGRPDPMMCCTVDGDSDPKNDVLLCCGPCGGVDNYPSNCQACKVQYPPGKPMGKPAAPLTIFIKGNKEILMTAD